MTPDKARDLLDGTTPGPWLSDLDRNSDEPSGIYAVVAQGGGFSARLVAEEIGEEADTALIAATPTLAAMIAGMREEWGVSYTGVNHDGRHTEWGYETRDEAERQARRYRLCQDMHPIRIVRRYVTTEEEA